MAFNLAIAPWLTDGIANGGHVIAQSQNEAPYAIKAAAMSIVHPVIDAVQIFATQDATEAHLKAAHSCKAWRGRAFYGISTAVRARLAAAFGKDRPAAFIEDAVAFLGAVPTLVLVMSPKTVEVTARVHGDKSFAQPPDYNKI